MAEALTEARLASEHGDVPIGALVLDPSGAVIARAHNERELTGDPSAHAELLALRRAAAALSQTVPEERRPELAEDDISFLTVPEERRPELAKGDASRRPAASWRLDDCTLVVTLEPCTMCAGALVLARVKRLVFGAYDPKAGAVASLWDVVRDPRLNHRVEVVGGIAAEACGHLIQEFFEAQRTSPHRP